MLLFGSHQKFKGHFLYKLRVFFNEAIKNPSAGAWSSLMCMLALSSVLCCNIENVYLDEGNLVGKNNKWCNKTQEVRIQNKGYSSNFVDQF